MRERVDRETREPADRKLRELAERIRALAARKAL